MPDARGRPVGVPPTARLRHPWGHTGASCQAAGTLRDGRDSHDWSQESPDRGSPSVAGESAGAGDDRLGVVLEKHVF